MFSIPFAVKARDKVTGMEGIVTGRCEHLTGCNTIGLTKTTKDGDKYETFWFDETRLEVIDPNPVMDRPWALDAVVVSPPKAQATAAVPAMSHVAVRAGGPHDAPERSNPDPS